MKIVKLVKSYQIINPALQLFSKSFPGMFQDKNPTSFPVSHDQSCAQRSFCSEPRRVDEVWVSSWKVMELLKNAGNLKFPNDNVRIVCRYINDAIDIYWWYILYIHIYNIIYLYIYLHILYTFMHICGMISHFCHNSRFQKKTKKPSFHLWIRNHLWRDRLDSIRETLDLKALKEMIHHVSSHWRLS